MTAKVLILDASERSALAFIRSLGRRGIEVIAGDSSRFTTGQLSRYVKKILLYPAPEKSWNKFIKFLLRVLSKESYDMVIPVSEFTTTILSFHKKELERYTIVAAPDYDKYINTYDKALAVFHARKYDIPHPKTYVVQDPNEVKELAKNLSYPVVIKPRRKTYWYEDKAKVLKVTHRNYAYNPDDLIRKYNAILNENKELFNLGLLPIIQEYILGPTYGYEALLNHGNIKAFFMHKRLAEYPITGGASTLRESTYHSLIAEIGAYTLQTLKWHGLAMAEFKLDLRDRIPKLIEINGRPLKIKKPSEAIKRRIALVPEHRRLQGIFPSMPVFKNITALNESNTTIDATQNYPFTLPKAHNITIATEGTETIDGQSTQTINTNYGVLRIYSDGTNWFTM